MKFSHINNPPTGVPKQVFERFIEKLREKDVAEEIVERLKFVLLDYGDTSEERIKAALFSDDELNI